MDYIRCVSSIALGRVNVFRNPQGEEANWSYVVEPDNAFNLQREENFRKVQLAKASICQCASFIIGTIAIIETVAYATFAAISHIFIPYSNKYYTISRKLLSSSLFTIVWVFSKLDFSCLPPNGIKAICCFCVGHIFQNEPTHEAFARKKYKPEWFFREEDREAMIQKLRLNISREWILNYTADELSRGCLMSVEDDPVALKKFLIKQMEPYRSNEEDDETYQCAIGLDPLMDPVQDPTAKGERPVFYERKVIENWLDQKKVSPVTRKPLVPNELIGFERFEQRHQEAIRRIQQRT